MTDMIRSAAGLAHAVDLLVRDDNWRRALDVHRPDRDRCVSCAEPSPCSVARLASAAGVQAQKDAERAAVLAREARARWWRWTRRQNRPQGATERMGDDR